MPRDPKRPLLPYDDALALLLSHAAVLGAQQVGLDDALGCTLRSSVSADRDQPPFNRSAMDGFAVEAELDLSIEHPVRGVAPAGAWPDPLTPGSVMRIATGAPLPRGAQAVIPIEQTQVRQEGEQEHVRFDVPGITPWQNVHRQASDATAGDEILRPGIVIAPHHVGICAALGAAKLDVTQRPRVTILSTGDEVRPPNTPTAALEPQQIRNSNAPMLRALLRAMGAELVEHLHAKDEPQPTRDAAEKAIAQSDLVLTIGGVSVGQRDLLPQTWDALGLQTLLHGIAIQPGKPVFAATGESAIVVGLPGNPVSVWATAHLMVWPLLRKMLGARDGQLPWREATLAEPTKASSKREVFRAARLLDDGRAQIINWHGSGDLMHTAGAQALVRLPQQDEPVAAGAKVRALILPGA